MIKLLTNTSYHTCLYLLFSMSFFSFLPPLPIRPSMFPPLRPQTAAKKVWRSHSISMITLPKNVNGWKSGNVNQPRIEAWHYGQPKSSGCVRGLSGGGGRPLMPSQRLVKGINQQLKLRRLRLIGV